MPRTFSGDFARRIINFHSDFFTVKVPFRSGLLRFVQLSCELSPIELLIISYIELNKNVFPFFPGNSYLLFAVHSFEKAYEICSELMIFANFRRIFLKTT